jgi:hypothetical protein
MVVVEVATRQIHGVRRWATEPWGADLELDLTAPAGHVRALTMKALVVVEGRRRERAQQTCVEVWWFVLERKSEREE